MRLSKLSVPLFCSALFGVQLISWRQANAVTQLSQADFEDGTFIISEAGRYELIEDITFLPNLPNASDLGSIDEPELFLFPTEAQRADGGEYSARGFALGFFAALIIETNDVVLDLNGFTIKQGELHALMQRFFAVIEVTNAPFPPNTGPADFASLDSFLFGRNVTIANGTIGVSAHHGIHCNNCEDLVLRDLTIEEFEVAGISLNAAKGVTLDSVNVVNSRVDVKWNGRLSQAIFALQAFSVHIDPLIDFTEFPEMAAVVEEVRLKQEALREELEEVIYAEVNGELSENPLFVTLTEGLPDGSLLAGIIIHPKVNVGDFANTLPGNRDPIAELDFRTFNIVMMDVVVENLASRPSEKTVLFKLNAGGEVDSGYQSAGAVADMIGAVFDVDAVRDLDSDDFEYVGNTLGDFQIALASFSFKFLEVFDAASLGRDLTAEEISVANLVRRNSITEEVISWSAGELTWNDLITDENYALESNHDFMFHLSKGIIGIKIDGTETVGLENVRISCLENLALEDDRSFFFRNLEVAAEVPEEITTSDSEYLGFAVRGISFASDISVQAINVIVDGLLSLSSNDVTAVDYINENIAVSTSNLDTDTQKTSQLAGELVDEVGAVIEYQKIDEFAEKESCPDNDSETIEEIAEDLLFAVIYALGGLSVVLLLACLFICKAYKSKSSSPKEGSIFKTQPVKADL